MGGRSPEADTTEPKPLAGDGGERDSPCWSAVDGFVRHRVPSPNTLGAICISLTPDILSDRPCAPESEGTRRGHAVHLLTRASAYWPRWVNS
jgi:hypothetical protein